MEVIGGTAGIPQLAQIAFKIYSSFQEYYLTVRDAWDNIKRLRLELQVLQDALVAMKDLSELPETDLSTEESSLLQRFCERGGLADECQSILEYLHERLQRGMGGDLTTMKAFGLRSLKCPFSSKEFSKILENLGRYKSYFAVALQAVAVFVFSWS